MRILLQVISEPLDEVLLFPVLGEVTFGELLLEIDDTQNVDRLPVELHDEEVFADVREVDDTDLLVAGRVTVRVNRLFLHIVPKQRSLITQTSEDALFVC